MRKIKPVIAIAIAAAWRWDNLPKYAHLNFPKPAVINNQKYRNRAALDGWMRSRVVEGVTSRRKAKSRSAAVA